MIVYLYKYKYTLPSILYPTGSWRELKIRGRDQYSSKVTAAQLPQAMSKRVAVATEL